MTILVYVKTQTNTVVPTVTYEAYLFEPAQKLGQVVSHGYNGAQTHETEGRHK